MAHATPAVPAPPSRKRKEPSTASSNAKSAGNKKQKVHHQARRRDARTLSTQTTSKAFQNGALDVSAFVKAREFEIHALEQGIQRSGKANNRRAFQLVPKELRRRTASHNAKRVPKRLRERAVKEMIEDNTPTVNARTRKPTRHMRLRLENVKKLRALGAKNKAARKKEGTAKSTESDQQPKEPAPNTETEAPSIQPRKPRIKKKPSLATPPTPKAKFRKRQVHKSWLPTHLFHTKRAHMTPPSAPLWRFTIPLTPTQKSYRPTHRAAHERGAIAWDMSYMSTIGLEGSEGGLEIVLKGLGVNLVKAGEKWKRGLRARTMWAYERETKLPIAPITVIWCALTATHDSTKRRSLFIRVHPSAFVRLWEEVLQLASVAKPSVSVEDLRFEIGSVEIAGPGSTEALLSALWPTGTPANGSVEKIWDSLAGLTFPSTLSEGALLGFDIQDPRLHFPPRTIALPKAEEDYNRLLELVADLAVDQTQPPPTIFSRTARQQGAKLRSQKAINRRKSLSAPGTYPEALPTDSRIPVLLYATPPGSSPTKSKSASSWTLLAPWKAVQPIWYSIQYYPLSTGQQPRFGGLNEQRQLSFEAGQPWFPADFPGTKAGWEWEMDQRAQRLQEWERRPKGRRISWEKVDLGDGKKGEIGLGWACDWSRMLKTGEGADSESSKPTQLAQASSAEAVELLAAKTAPQSGSLHGKLATVRLTLLSRGVPQTCARIYRLPSQATSPNLREAWLALHPKHAKSIKRCGSKVNPTKPDKTVPSHIRQQILARSLLQPARAGDTQYPACPGEEDLIGFATTGNFNLAEGKGTGIGCLMLDKVVEDVTTLSGGEGRLCVVRNSGDGVGRLAAWEVV